MQVEVGAVVEGTVTGITKFGAFVSLPDGRSGLVHISEIANTYVSDVNEFLKLGDKVKVRVLAVTPDGKINLSIKKVKFGACLSDENIFSLFIFSYKSRNNFMRMTINDSVNTLCILSYSKATPASHLSCC